MVHRLLLGEYKGSDSLCSFYLLSHNLTFSPSSFPPDSIIEDIYYIKVPMPSSGPLPLLQIHKSHILVHARSGPMVSYMSEWKYRLGWYPHIPRSKQITFTHSISHLVCWPYLSRCTITIYDCKMANTLLFLELHWLCNTVIHKNASKCRFQLCLQLGKCKIGSGGM